MYKPRKQTEITSRGRLKVGTLDKVPELKDVRNLFAEAERTRGCLCELFVLNPGEGLAFVLTCRYDQGVSEPIWSLYQGQDGAKTLWTYPTSNYEMIYDITCMSLAENVLSAQTVAPASDANSLPGTNPGNQSLLSSALSPNNTHQNLWRNPSNNPNSWQSVSEASGTAQPPPAPAPAAQPAQPANPINPVNPVHPSQWSDPQILNQPAAAPSQFDQSVQQGQPIQQAPGQVSPEQWNQQQAMQQAQLGRPVQPSPNSSGQWLHQSVLQAPPNQFVQPGQFVQPQPGQLPPEQFIQSPMDSPKISAAIPMDLINKRSSNIMLGELLVEAGVIPERYIDSALKVQELFSKGLISREESIDALRQASQAQGVLDERISTLSGRNNNDPRELARRVIDLIRQAGLISEQDIESASKVRAKHGGDVGQILVSAGKIDKVTLDSAKVCLPYIEVGRVKKEQAIMALHYCQRTRMPLEAAFKELQINLMP